MESWVDVYGIWLNVVEFCVLVLLRFVGNVVISTLNILNWALTSLEC